jgi:hypothetical protein
MLTRQLAGELAPQVLVNAIAPGLFPSKMTAGILDAGTEAVGRQIPLQRIGRTEDIAGLAVFLASRASTYITGAIIPMDGGLTATRQKTAHRNRTTGPKTHFPGTSREKRSLPNLYNRDIPPGSGQLKAAGRVLLRGRPTRFTL